jgi:hypothetical protein
MLSFERVFRESMPSLMVGACTIHLYLHFDKVKVSKNCKIDEVTRGYLNTSTMNGPFGLQKIMVNH